MAGSAVALKAGAMGAALIILNVVCGPLAVSSDGCGDSCICPNKDACMSGAPKNKCDYCSSKCRLKSTYSTDVNNCGSCGKKCTGAGASCVGGKCVPGTPICSANFGDCDRNAANGCEANLKTDVNNCQTCGVKCEYAHAEATCAQGTCVMGACKQGYANCDGDSTNGCELALTTTRTGCNCPEGTAGANCDVCPANTYSAGGSPSSTTCISCSTGLVSNQGATTCTPCEPGFGSNNGTCTQCSPGTYSPGGNFGVGLCEVCPGVSIAPNPGSSSCDPCPAGLAAADGKTACVGLRACDNIDVCNSLVIRGSINSTVIGNNTDITGAGNCVCNGYQGGRVTASKTCQANVRCAFCRGCLDDNGCPPNYSCADSCGGIGREYPYSGFGYCVPNCGQPYSEEFDFKC